MANHNPVGDSRTVAAETYTIDKRHCDAPLQVTTLLSLSDGWEVLQESHQAYVAGVDKHDTPLEPMERLQLGMIGAMDGSRVAVNVSMTAARQRDDAPEEPLIDFTLKLYAGNELLDTFTRTRNRLPASFYAKIDIVLRK